MFDILESLISKFKNNGLGLGLNPLYSMQKEYASALGVVKPVPLKHVSPQFATIVQEGDEDIAQVQLLAACDEP